ncbi:MAG: lysylphosphatidylglycerol synthase transmembrane domain-containing protein [Candidatus Latescibacterota bacterium]
MRFSNSALQKIAIYLLSLVCVVWVIRGVRFDELAHQLRNMQIWWILPAVLLDIFTTVAHGVRWRIIIEPIGSAPLLRFVQAIYSSLFANEILPLKAGEFVRGYLMSRWLGAPFSSILPTMVTERVFDGSLLVAGFGLSSLFVPLPQQIVTAGVFVGAIMLAAITALLILAFTSKKRSPARTFEPGGENQRPARHIAAFLSQFADGLRTIRTLARFCGVLAASIVYLFSQVLAYWMIMKAYGLHFSLWVPAVVLVIVRLGTALPSAPANIGPYQFFCVLALTLFGVDKTTAAGFAVALWLIFSIPILILGFTAFIKSGLSLSDVRRRHP